MSDLFDREAEALALWKVEATLSYKRHIMVNLYDLIRQAHNQTDSWLFVALRHRCHNLTRTEFECALASLKAFDVVGIYPVPGADGEFFHVNRKKTNAPAWKKYTKRLRAISRTQVATQ